MIIPNGVGVMAHGSGVATVAIARTPVAGNLIWVAFMSNDRANAASVSDTQGHTWIVCNPDFNDATNTVRMQSWYTYAKNSLATTITFTTNGAGGFITGFCHEFANVGALDKVAQSPAASTGAPTSPAFVPAVDGEVVLAMVSDTITAVGNIDGSPATKGGDDLNGDWSEHRILVGRNGVSMTAAFTGSGAFDIMVATFMPKVKTAPVPIRPRMFAPGLAR